MDRRHFLTGLAAGGTAFGLALRHGAALAQAPAAAPPAASPPAAAPAAPPPPPAYKLPDLGYGYDALEPFIDTATMRIHHSAHHQAYVTNANALATQWAELRSMPMESVLKDLSVVPEAQRTGVRNNVGGHWNHSFFWELMTPGGAQAPAGDLKSAIEGAFGSSAALVTAFNAAGMGRFGSGWAWLVVDKDGKLAIVSTANQDTPLELGAKAVVIGCDVWEHAYYLKHQNRRADYLRNWWSTVNWDKAMANFKKAV